MLMMADLLGEEAVLKLSKNNKTVTQLAQLSNVDFLSDHVDISI